MNDPVVKYSSREQRVFPDFADVLHEQRLARRRHVAGDARADGHPRAFR